MIMNSRIIIIFLIFVSSNYLKGENELLKVKIDVKLSKSNIINKKNVGEDQILSGVFYGKTESIEDKNFADANLECDFIGRSYQGRGFSCGFAVIEDLKGFCYMKNNNNFELLNKKILIVGFGRIGRQLIKRCLGFEMKVDVYDPFVEQKIIKSFGGNKVNDLNEGLSKV